jgi:hypothetical protein
MRLRAVALSAGCVALALAPAARAAFFSFASDYADQAWTFRGNGSGFNTQSMGLTDYVVLHLDDNNGLLPRLTFTTRFAANVTFVFAGDVNLGNGSVSHNYAAAGSFSFVDVATNSTLMTGSFSDALFTARGTATTWATTAALQQDNSIGGMVLNWTGTSLPGYGLQPGLFTARQFGLDLASINSSGAVPYAGQNPGVNLSNSMPSSTWFAESSFVAVIPAPATLALLSAGILVAARRRR